MAQIDLASFAEECVGNALTVGVLPEYVMAVAKVRSDIDDAVSGNETGPFRLTPEQWDANRRDPEGLLDLEPSAISDWKAQCVVFPRMVAATQTSLRQQLGRNFSMVELYRAQWPAADNPVQLATQFTNALQIVNPAVRTALDNLHQQQAPIVNDPKQSAIS